MEKFWTEMSFKFYLIDLDIICVYLFDKSRKLTHIELGKTLKEFCPYDDDKRMNAAKRNDQELRKL